MSGSGTPENIEMMMGRVLGVKDIKANKARGSVKVSYNLKFINYSDILKKLNDFGCPPKTGLFNTIRLYFIDFTEKNERVSKNFSLERYPIHPHGKPAKN